ncbi:MAG: peptidoglycan DD-metalloendopeptidase family protein [Ruminococcus sp.]|nr:peptidoglycan DD-metalloendopeptidase family protein [Ruminococcus sp.]MBQ2442569.1 peptidoglycan DD-metalloendopeptidase family protein [Ruminococcus sp.]MBQ2538296.1 peptidoglycan DD-metalloendopeptidase family protein [Ruminococcus sp.]MBQ4214632.1 peptidoglycan DD-metalloendopeptidase family protein [Ruminococcus sp.]
MTKCKKIFCALLSVCLITVAPIGTVFSVSAEEEETDTHSLAERISNLGQKKEEYEKILQKNAKEISDKEEYNRALTEKIKVLSEKVTLTRESISDLTDSISTSQKEIDQANEDIEGQLDALCGRLRAIYMAGSASELEIILGAKDFSDMIDKVNLVKTLTKYDDELIENISDKLDEIENKQTQMQEDKEQLLTDETTLDADLKDLNKTLEENEETLKKLRDSSAEAQDFLADADNEQTLMESQIRKYFEKKAQTADIVTDGKYVWPCPGYYTLSSLFRENRTSYFHGGIDIAGGGIMGSPVLAAEAGTVVGVFTGCPHNWGKEKCCACGSYGNYVWLDHGNGKETIYGHLTSAGVQPGDTVKKGQVIGLVGSTGNSTGPHLHFECRMNGDKYDPMTEF